MLNSIQKAFKVKEVRDRLLYTFMMLVVIRIGCCLPIPGVDPSYLHDFFSNLQNSGMGFFNAITGGSFSSMSIFALSITPYITSSIIMQLLTIAIPKLEEMQKDGEDGRKKIAEYTRYLTVGLALFESCAMAVGLGGKGLLLEDHRNIWGYLTVVAANRALKHATDVPGTFQNIIEFGMEMLENMTTGILGSSANRFANYIGTIFLFILFCNLSGLFGLRTVTADFGVTFLLGLVTFAIVQYQGIKNHGVGHFTGLFQPLPVLFPINLIGEFANPISISLRLFANMLSGVIIMGLWYGMMPVLLKIGIPAALHVYCDLFSGCIQTYVFCMLTMVYVNDKL